MSYYYNGTLDINNNYWINTSQATYGRATQKSNVSAEPKSADELKSLTATLGDAYIDDGKKIDRDGNIIDNLDNKGNIIYINDGYPILKWQIENN